MTSERLVAKRMVRHIFPCVRGHSRAAITDLLESLILGGRSASRRYSTEPLDPRRLWLVALSEGDERRASSAPRGSQAQHGDTEACGVGNEPESSPSESAQGRNPAIVFEFTEGDK